MNRIRNFFRRIDLSDERTKDFIAGLIALIFVVIAGYLALNRFNNPAQRDLGTGGQIEREDVSGTVDEQEQDQDVSGDQDQMENGQMATESEWVATDYQEGDIEAGQYTVQSGDTLWEISEAVYGTGTMWTQILDANSGDIGHLPNGTQALITPGQTLTIPSI